MFGNRVAVNTATTGTGTLTLGSEISDAYCTFAEGGITNAATVRYLLTEGDDFEIGSGTYTASGTTLSRTTVEASKIGGTAGTSKMNLAGGAEVRVIASAEDLTRGWELIGSANDSIGGTVATVDFTSIDEKYSELYLRFWDVSHNNGSNTAILVGVSHNNGTNYSSSATVTPSGSSSFYFNGIAHFTGRHTPMVAAYYAGDSSGAVKSTTSGTTPVNVNNPASSIPRLYYSPEGQVIDAVRVAAGAGSLDLYNIELWGRK